MSLTYTQRLERIEVRNAEFQFWRARKTLVVEGWHFNGQPIAVGEALPQMLPCLKAGLLRIHIFISTLAVKAF
jgi:alpha-mannosidase